MRVVAGVLCVGLLVAFDAVAEPTWNDRCKLPANADGVTIIKVDANTGELLEGSLNVGAGSKLRVDFLGKNPFKYAYRFGTTSQLADSVAVAQYLKRLPVTVGSATAGVETGARPKAMGGIDGAKCEPVKEWLDTLSNRLKDLEDRGKKLDTDLKGAQGFIKLYETLVNKTDSASFTTTEACLQTVVPVDDFMKTQVPTLPSGVEKFPDEVAALELMLKNPPKPEGTDCAAAQLGERLKTVIAAKEEAGKVINALHMAEKAQGTIRDLLQDPEVFHASRFPVLTNEATVVHVQLFRRNLRQESSSEQAVGAFDIKAGRGRFFITAGALVSILPYRHVVRQQGRVTPESDVTTLFAYEEESKFLVAPAVLLSVRFVDIPNIESAVHATFGVLGTQDAFEIVVGPSFAFAGERVFITLGAHAARREELSGGFQVGQPVPEALTDPLPTTKGWKVGAAAGLSFRLE